MKNYIKQQQNCFFNGENKILAVSVKHFVEMTSFLVGS